MSKTLKILLGVLGLAVVALGIVYALRGSGNRAPAETGLVATDTAGAPTIAGTISASTPNAVDVRTQELVALLNSVSSLQLDSSVFEHPAFQLLDDISTDLPPVAAVGRNNPFLPIGSDGRINISGGQSNTVSFPSASSLNTSGANAAVTNQAADDQTPEGQDALDAFLNNN